MSKVLVAGPTGGREHALGAAMAGEGHEVYFSHGNGGSREVGTNLGLTTSSEIVGFAGKQAMDLVVIGPESALVEGLANDLRGGGLTVFGPDQHATRIEASKA